MMKMVSFARLGLLTAAIGTVGVATVSCGVAGGGGSGSQPSSGSGEISAQASGALTVAVRWPQRAATTPGAHIIPDDANSILMLLVQNSATIASACLARPAGTSGATTSSYTFSGVPTGSLSVNASAYADGACSQSQPAQATGTAAVSVEPGVSQSVVVTLVGTMASVSVTPSAPTITVGGGPVTLTATALDGQGDTVLTAPGDWVWSCSASGAVSPASGTGAQAVLTGAQVGETVCTFTTTQAPGATPVKGSVTVTVQSASTPSPSPTPTPAPEYKLTTLLDFDGANGEEPGSGLLSDGHGDLYGTANGVLIDGSSGIPVYGIGLVYELRIGGGITTLASTFGFTPPGLFTPVGLSGLVSDGEGNFYFTSKLGGGSADGMVYQYNAASGVTTAASFNGTNGQMPSGLISDGQGNYYGTTLCGGIGYTDSAASSGDGTIYRWTANAGITALADFDGTNGTQPQSGLVSDGQGNLYGTTTYGGLGYNGSPESGSGTIFRWSASAGIITLASFTGPNGSNPVAGLIADGHGNFFGTTSAGGDSNDGTIFEWNATSGVTTLASFNGTNGMYPSAGLVTDGAGNFYGTTEFGGSSYNGSPTSGCGTVFVYNSVAGLTSIASFSGLNGMYPQSVLIGDGLGDFFGTTQWGGNGYTDAPYTGYGTIFELSPMAVQGAVRRSAVAASPTRR